MTNKIYEIIGMNVSVIESTNSQIVGISGYVVDETKHMLTINTKLGKKLIVASTGLIFLISFYFVLSI